MAKKARPRTLKVAQCVERPAPWRRRSRNTVKITVIVVEVMRVIHGDARWQNSLESVLAVAIALLAAEMVYGVAYRFADALRGLMPEQMVLKRVNGKRKLSFGW
ncbi:hypothetical protein ACIQCJ_17030 [Streptomyces sp. NPDC093221]|uniref:hypothetical protein n=1 Tax=Streptomyces sp. NPDC093221 TaxID=3366032 RepID=UPI00381FE87D